MNYYALIIFLIGTLPLLSAQSTSLETSVIAIEIFPAADSEKMPLETTQREIAHHYGQYHKRLPADYSGYIIELLNSDRPLSREHRIFQQFGKVFYDKLADGQYSYCIKAENFSSVASLQRYVENMIHHRAPTAVVVEYKSGKRRKKARDKSCCPGLDKL